MEFFVKDGSKAMWHRVQISDIIMVEDTGKAVQIHRINKPNILISISIDLFLKTYLKGKERFVRTSSDHIVNKDMVVSMVERKGMFYLQLEEGKEALMRRSHDYAYTIQSNDKKPPMKVSENDTEEQQWIDKIIMTYTDCNHIADLVFSKTGKTITTREIRARYKRIKFIYKNDDEG
jgi:hypothetical protein